MEIQYLIILLVLANFVENFDIFKLFSRQNTSQWRNYSTVYRRYSYFGESERLRLRNEAKEMFYFGYDNYIKYAYPLDELDPIHCTGRGPDYDDAYVLAYYITILYCFYLGFECSYVISNKN